MPVSVRMLVRVETVGFSKKKKKHKARGKKETMAKRWMGMTHKVVDLHALRSDDERSEIGGGGVRTWYPGHEA